MSMKKYHQHDGFYSDVVIWPDGFHCTRDELWEYPHKSDDYVIYPRDKPLDSDFPDQQTYEAFKEAIEYA